MSVLAQLSALMTSPSADGFETAAGVLKTFEKVPFAGTFVSSVNVILKTIAAVQVNNQELAKLGKTVREVHNSVVLANFAMLDASSSDMTPMILGVLLKPVQTAMDDIQVWITQQQQRCFCMKYLQTSQDARQIKERVTDLNVVRMNFLEGASLFLIYSVIQIKTSADKLRRTQIAETSSSSALS